MGMSGRVLVVYLVSGRAFGAGWVLGCDTVKDTAEPFGFPAYHSSHDCCLTPIETGRLARALLAVPAESSLIGSGSSGVGGSVCSRTIGSCLSAQKLEKML